MIIGQKDKERVRQMELECESSRALIAELKNDLETIGKAVDNKLGGIESVLPPFHKIWNDIGRCAGHLKFYMDQ